MMYTQDDSDNESSSAEDEDFKPIYRAEKDSYSDLTNLHKPQFLSDLILGYSSDNYDRFTQALESGALLIQSQSLNDVEHMAPDLLQVLFRTENKFDLD
jgi:hypothetical protein